MLVAAPPPDASTTRVGAVPALRSTTARPTSAGLLAAGPSEAALRPSCASNSNVVGTVAGLEPLVSSMGVLDRKTPSPSPPCGPGKATSTIIAGRPGVLNTFPAGSQAVP